jgi:eukaryotic-like serine/threonine-protein kinase
MPMLMKVPKLSEGEDPAAIVGVEMEQMILPRLSGVHVPKFVAVGDFAVQPYIVMERVTGKTLLARLPDLPLPYAEVAEIGARVAAALDDLHRQHVIHLDVKPSNLMFRPTGEIVLLDFGLSHHDHLPDLMQEEFRVPFGTAPYMAPEQLLGIRHDPRSDQFALGVLLYFFSTGVRPFVASVLARQGGVCGHDGACPSAKRGSRRNLAEDPHATQAVTACSTGHARYFACRGD